MTDQPQSPALVNGLDRGRLEEIIDTFRDPGEAEGHDRPWRARVVWEGGTRCKAHARQHRIEFDEPGLGAPDVAATPLEALLCALGACVAGAFSFHATRAGVRIYNLEVVLEGRFGGVRTIFALGEDASFARRGIAAKAYVRAEAEEAVLQDLWRKAVEASLVTLSLARGTPLDFDLEVV